MNLIRATVYLKFEFGPEIIETNSKQHFEGIERSRCLEYQVDNIAKDKICNHNWEKKKKIHTQREEEKERKKSEEKEDDEKTENIVQTKSAFWIWNLAFSMKATFCIRTEAYFCFDVWSFV